MTELFKCLVEINDRKYKIIINNKFNSITFNDLLNELLKISSLEDISLERHSFEIFDTDFNEYVLIRSGEQFIDNLSRIRVSLKPEYNRNTSERINSWVEVSKPSQVLNTRQTLRTDDKFVAKSFQTIHEFKSIISETRHEISFKTKGDNTQVSHKTHETNDSSIRNGYKTNSNTNICEKNDKKINSNDENIKLYNRYEVCLFMIELINKNSCTFNKCLNKTTLDQRFSMLSKLMIENGFKKFDAKVCQNFFTKINGLYIETLKGSANYKIACEKYQLFKVIHDSYENFRPFFNIKTFNQNMLLRENIMSSNNIDNKTITDLNESFESLNMNTYNPCIDDSDAQSFPALISNNISISGTSSNSHVSYASVVKQKTDGTSNAREELDCNENVVSSAKNTTQDLMTENMKKSEINNNSFVGNAPQIANISNYLYPINQVSFNVYQFNLDFILLNIINNFCVYFNTNEPLFVWQLIALEMSKYGFVGWSAYQCLIRFSTLINNYFQISFCSTNFEKASQEFALFSKMNSIDSSHPFLFSYIHQSLTQTNSNLMQPFLQNYTQFKKTLSNTQLIATNSVNSVQNTRIINSNSRPPVLSQKLSHNCFAKEFEDLLKNIKLRNAELIQQILNANDVKMQFELFYERFLLKANDIENRFKLKNKLQEILCENGFNCVLHIFGSTLNKLGFRDTDIDIFIELPQKENIKEKIKFSDAVIHLNRIHSILTQSLGFVIRKPIAKPLMRCPLIRVDFSNISQNLKNRGIICDLNLSNALSLRNTKLIRLFCDIEPRFQALATILRYWAKMNGFISSTQFSSYAFTQLVIFFCQNTSPPLLPSVDNLRQLAKESLLVNGWECSFCDDHNLIEKSKNKQTVIELFAQFFKFYSKFDFSSQIISTKSGSSQQKDFIFKQNIYNFQIKPFCCIEDPFDLNHNITERLSENSFHKFITFVKQLAIKSNSLIGAEKMDSSHWGIAKMLTNFDPTNGYVYYGRSIPIPSSIVSNGVIEDFISLLCARLISNQLNGIHKIDCTLTESYNIVVNELSPFVEFIVNLNKINLEVIKPKNRKLIKQENPKTCDAFTYENRITDILIRKFDKIFNNNENIVQISLRIKLLVNACISCPFISLEVIDVNNFGLDLKKLNSESKSIIKFIKNLIAIIVDDLNVMNSR